jgi:hypothetical protein
LKEEKTAILEMFVLVALGITDLASELRRQASCAPHQLCTSVQVYNSTTLRDNIKILTG